MASFSRNIDGVIRLLRLIDTVGQKLLYRVFLYGCPNKDRQQNLIEYFHEKGLGRRELRIINKTERVQIIDADPSCENLHVNLLYKVIQIACDYRIADIKSPVWHTADELNLEYLLYQLKSKRGYVSRLNEYLTEIEVNHRIDELRTLFERIIEAYAVRFDIDDTIKQEHLNSLHLEVDQIRHQPISTTEIEMSENVNISDITDMEIKLVQLMKLIKMVGPKLLHKIFIYGCPDKGIDENLIEYLLRNGHSRRQFGRYFDRSSIEKIEADPSCEKFDIMLLYNAIKLACNYNIADTNSSDWFTPDESKLEYLITKLKSTRNEVMHSVSLTNTVQVNEMINELTTLFENIIEVYAVRFNIDHTTKQHHLNSLQLEVHQILDFEQWEELDESEEQEQVGPSVITDEQKQYLRLFLLMDSVAQKLMYRVFLYGCPHKDKDKNLREYLQEEPFHMSNTAFNKAFNNTDIENIEGDPSCQSFDVSLLYKVIREACNYRIAEKFSDDWKTDPKLENLLKQLKDKRNDVYHKKPRLTKTQVNQEIEELRTLSEKIVKAYVDRFSIDDETKKQHLESLHLEVNQIRDLHLTQAEFEEYREQNWQEIIKDKLLRQGVKELKNKFGQFITFNPISFLMDCDIHIDFHSVFSEIVIVEADNNRINKNIDYKDIIELSTQTKGPCLIFIKGVAGSGKSTLIRWLILEWEKTSNANISTMNDYDFVIHLECRDRQNSSFEELIKSHISTTYSDPDIIDKDSLIAGIRNLRVLFVVDGLDERNECSKKIIEEILKFSKDRDHLILCTSRPEKSKEFLIEIPSEFKKFLLEIKGIQPKEQSIFAGKYYEHFKQKFNSTRSTKELVRYVEVSSHLNEVYRFPLNLVFISFVWAKCQNEIHRITTSTELYEMIYELLEENLINRLVKLYSSKIKELDSLEEKIEEFVTCVSMEALISLSLHQVILQKPSLNRMRETCMKSGVFGFNDICSTYFTQKSVGKIVSKEEYTFHHKDTHDYFGAKGLLLAITNENSEYEELRTKISSPSEDYSSEYKKQVRCGQIIKHILKVLTIRSVEFNDYQSYQNVLKHLAGLLESKNVKESITKELVEVFSLSGINNEDEWIRILSETKYNDEISKLIAKSFFIKENNVTIKDYQVGGFSSLMPHLKPTKITLQLDSDPHDLPHLDHLLKSISQIDNCKLQLNVMQHYQEPKENIYTDFLLSHLLDKKARCRIIGVRGCLRGDGLENLILEDLHVVLKCNQQAKLVTSNLLQQPHDLKHIRVMRDVKPDYLTALPHGCLDNRLDLSNVTLLDMVNWARDVAIKLAHKTSLKYVYLPVVPNCLQGAEVGLKLEHELKEARVNIDNFHPFSYIKKTDELKNIVDIPINEENMNDMMETIAFSNPNNVKFIINDDPKNLTQLKDLIKLASMKTCNIELLIWQHYRSLIDKDNTDDLFECLINTKCQLIKFTGILSEKMIYKLPNTLTHIHISLINNSQAQSVIEYMHKLHNLNYIELHIGSKVHPDYLTTLPNITKDKNEENKEENSNISLYISNLKKGHEERAALVALKLQPQKGFCSIQYPWCSLEAEVYKCILEALSKHNINVKDIYFPYTHNITSQYHPLKCIAEDTLKSTLKLTPFIEWGMTVQD